MMLYHHTIADKCNKILEVGVGTGRSALMFSQSFMQKGAVYVNTDISDNMIKIFKENLGSTGYDLDHQESYKAPEAEEDKKKIVILKANNEDLPFPDEEFDCYISNFSMHIVDNHHNQLLEAYRVLKPGCKAGFSVWGDKSRNNCFTFLQTTLKKLGYETDLSAEKSFCLSDPVDLRKDILTAGFKVCKNIVVNLPMAHKYPEDFLNIMVKGNFEDFAQKENLTEPNKTELWDQICQEFTQKYGPDTSEMPDFEQIICIATK
ncbi:unnamed protein product [Moneuplotes crassus]|uniref:Methyltransferase type 11 domain-containing protein n=1 Tax=Euplotes crassus TaxID=5936 RepID=A0AAD1XLX0_EUPCR|nr:unnamed protein product [Moneuplotes crassus]